VILPVSFENGTLEVDVCSGLNALAPDYYARGFAGLAYRISDARERFEAVYVRPLNGRSLKVHVDGDCLTAWIDGVEVMSVAPTLVPASQGHIGLFVDIGTEAYFSNLRITQA
jgi:hypothetical protein